MTMTNTLTSAKASKESSSRWKVEETTLPVRNGDTQPATPITMTKQCDLVDILEQTLLAVNSISAALRKRLHDISVINSLEDSLSFGDSKALAIIRSTLYSNLSSLTGSIDTLLQLQYLQEAKQTNPSNSPTPKSSAQQELFPYERSLL